MPSDDTVTVRYDIDRADVQRILRVRDNGLTGLWDLVDDMIELVELVQRVDGSLGIDEITEFTGNDELAESFVEWDRLADIRESGEEMTRLHVLEYLGLVRKAPGGYQLGALFSSDTAPRRSR